MKIKLSELRRLNFIEKVILHCHDQSLYLVSVQMDKEDATSLTSGAAS